MIINSVDLFQNVPKKICAQCGEPIEEQVESYMTECERCLAKKDE